MRNAICMTVTAFVLSAVLVGCEAAARSDQLEPGIQTTASYETIFSLPAKPSPIKPKNWAPVKATYAAPVVTHFPSWYLDEFATEGDGNDTYGWTWVDALAFGYCPARFFVNTVALPVSAVKQPPGVLVTTDLDEPIPEQGERLPAP